MNATFVSVWDGGTEIVSACQYDPLTKDVTDIDSVDVEDMDLDILDEQYVLFNGDKITEFTIEGEEI